ncbi:hypothetical protein ARMGADRAFT_344115 [Armillaria gallica]|uniref:Uncharacterized protein n=1 Tax=Armillaria gallica TaxID=47427 RepID=A0A2H3DMI6_ARMGA|nr:hypothetical protein ARMGADRAFT_344115 [Armillaria gallica]
MLDLPRAHAWLSPLPFLWNIRYHQDRPHQPVSLGTCTPVWEGEKESVTVFLDVICFARLGGRNHLPGPATRGTPEEMHLRTADTPVWDSIPLSAARPHPQGSRSRCAKRPSSVFVLSWVSGQAIVDQGGPMINVITVRDPSLTPHFPDQMCQL